jgi:hypothetical protein
MNQQFRNYLVLMLVFGMTTVFAGHLISTNRDTSGAFSPLRNSQPKGSQGKPSGVIIENLTQEVRKVEGNIFQIVLFGVIRIKVAERSADKIQLDYYTSGWGKAWDFPKYVGKKAAKGKQFTLKVGLYEKDTFSRDDLVLQGYQPIDLLASKSKEFAYEGKFKFLYEIPFSKIRKKIGLGDRPRIYAKVEIEKGEAGRGLWSRLKNGGSKSDVERLYLDSEFSQEDDNESRLQFFDGIEVPGEVLEDEVDGKKNLIVHPSTAGASSKDSSNSTPNSSRTVDIGKPVAFPYSCADLRYYSEILKELDTKSDLKIRGLHREGQIIASFPNPMERGILITDDVMQQQIIVFRSQSSYLKKSLKPEQNKVRTPASKPSPPSQRPPQAQGFYQPNPYFPQRGFRPPPGYQNPYAPPGYQPGPSYPQGAFRPPPPRRRKKRGGGMFSMFKSMNPMSMMGDMMGGMMGMNPMSMMGGMPGQSQGGSKGAYPKQMITVPTNEYLGATSPNSSGTCKPISGGNYATAADLNKIYGATPAFTGGNPGGSSGGFMDFFNMPMKMMTMPFETFNRMMDNGFKGIDRFGDKIDKFGNKIVAVSGAGRQGGGSVPCVAGGGGTVVNVTNNGSNNVVNITVGGNAGVDALKGSSVEEAVALYAKVYQEVKGQLKENYRIILAGPSEDRFLVRIASMYFYPEDIAFEQIMLNDGLVQDLCSMKGK